MISGQVCMAGRLHPTVQSKRTNLPGHWTKWTAPAVIPKITGSCFFAVCLVALFFPAGGHTKALAKRPPSFDFSRPIITPKMMSLSSPTNDCFKINSSTPLAELNGFFKKYPTGNLVQIKSGKNKQKTLSVNPMSYEVVWTGKDPKNNAKYFRTSRHPYKPGNLIENVFSCRHLCIDRHGKVYAKSSANINDDDECRFKMTFRNTAGTIAEHKALASLLYSNETHTLLLDRRGKGQARYVEIGKEDKNHLMIIFPLNKTVVLEEATTHYGTSSKSSSALRDQAKRRRKSRRRKCRQSVSALKPSWSVNRVKGKCRKKEFIRKCRKKQLQKRPKRRHRRRRERRSCSKKYRAQRKKRRNKEQAR
ncbi:uncharacterized protein LOC131877345 isoform X2 [Tigriopus californicus]|uniref:uncharacterized protein LOC131877345 isoform X2 n=1 Tax=Tigriopus californicus TaxID=6832 RepID=UPI0027DA8984|nr:uncharacterized protein LOC131877345 isoform X2 [Tigriopus californicus]